MRQFLLIIFLFSVSSTFSQVQDNFSDGDFTLNPVWSGDDSVFTIIDVSGNLKLRSNKLIASSSFYLSSPNTLVNDAQWEFSVNLTFNTSSANYVDLYLLSDQADLLSTTINGYFIRVGGIHDEISLYKTVNGSATVLIDGADGITNFSNNNFKVKAVRTTANDWTLERDMGGTGTSYVAEGTVNDASILSSSFFGIRITQSTASFFQRHFFDDIYIGPIILDLTPPTLDTVIVLDPAHVDALFSEPVEQTSAENIGNYGVIPFNSVSAALRDAGNLSLVHLTLFSPVGNGVTNTLSCNGIADNAGNIAVSQNANFMLLVSDVAVKGDLLITEFFCDPTPKVGLPELEFVEIYNKSSKIIELSGWKLGDNSSSGTVVSGWIFPGEYKVLCPTSAVDSFPNAFGVTSFPSLNNAGDDIVLKDTGSIVIDKITYDDTWYGDPIKQDGGYTIELINPNDPCSGKDNWIASNDPLGGTPGAVNSVFDPSPDVQAPSFVLLTALAPSFLSVDFSEGMDSLSFFSALVSASPGLTIAGVFTSGQFPTNVLIQFNENLAGSQIYTLNMQNVADCWMNNANLSGNFVLPEDAVPGDLIINEILSDPLTGADDFIEIKNNSGKLIDLKDYALANFDNDTIANNKSVAQHYFLKAGDYVVLTPDSAIQKQIYPLAVPGHFIQMSLPSYNNDSGTVFLIKAFTVLDKVSYLSDWQFALLDNSDGKSLERIDPYGVSNDKNNWHTAAETAGFATPGKENSQLRYGENDGEISLTTPLFSPDNDGLEDVLQVNYQLINSGMLASISIYDDRGRFVRNLVKSELIGNKGQFTWDGVNEDQQKASIGTYVLLFEAFDLAGKTISKKLPFVLAGKI